MKIAEIIKLRTLGYSKEEVQAFIDAEKEPPAPEDPPAEDPTPAPETTPPTPEPSAEDNILTAINNLTRAIQASNIIHDEQPKQSEETAQDILNNVLKQV